MLEWVFGKSEKENADRETIIRETDKGGNNRPMSRKRFDKEAFKEAVKDNVKTLYRKKIEEASQQQIFQAVSYAVKEEVIDDWLATQDAYATNKDAKTVYYMSMEFLMGRALGNNLINLTSCPEVKIGRASCRERVSCDV